MKRIAKPVSIFIAVVLAFVSLSVFVSAAGEDALTISIYDDIAAVTSCRTTASGIIDIPSEKNGIPVVMISDYAFESCTKITQINIPSSITKIGSNAFESCISLRKVVFAGSSCDISSAAFKYCSLLSDISLPTALKTIPEEAFYGCTSLLSLNIPQTVEIIGKEAFRICSAITEFNIPASVKVIEKNAFLGCSAAASYNVAAKNTVYSSVNGVLYGPYQSPFDSKIASPITDKALIQYPIKKADEAYTVQNGTVIIGDYAFGGNKSISVVNLPSDVKKIDAYAFNECTALSTVDLPDTVTVIGSQAFGRCTSLKSITIPASVTDYESAFYKSGLTSVVLENGVKKISQRAFDECEKLVSIKIPSSVKTIEVCAFNKCTSLGKIEIPSTVSTIGLNAFSECSAVKLIVEDGSVAHTYAVSNNIPYEIKTQGGDVPTTKPSDPTTNPTEPTRKIVSVSIAKLPDKTSYNYKDTISTDGLQLEVVYNNGDSEIVTSGFKINPKVCNERGVQTVTVEYQGFTASFQISVSFSIMQWIIWILFLGFLWY